MADIALTISKQTPEDFEGVQEVFYQAWRTTYPNQELGITVDDVDALYDRVMSPEGRTAFITMLMNAPENRIYLVAKDGGKAVGVSGAAIYDDMNQLHSIYVLLEYQRQGIGHMFWEKLQEFFDPDKDIVVHLATYNTQAFNFYTQLGFVDTSKRFTEERHRMPISGVLIPEMEMVLKRG